MTTPQPHKPEVLDMAALLADTTNRVVTIYQPAVSDLRGPWKFVDSVDYSVSLPY